MQERSQRGREEDEVLRAADSPQPHPPQLPSLLAPGCWELTGGRTPGYTGQASSPGCGSLASSVHGSDVRSRQDIPRLLRPGGVCTGSGRWRRRGGVGEQCLDPVGAGDFCCIAWAWARGPAQLQETW